VLAVVHVSQFDQCDVHLCLDRAVDHVVKLLDAMRAPVNHNLVASGKTCRIGTIGLRSRYTHVTHRVALADRS
jgi:hypothetical protein